MSTDTLILGITETETCRMKQTVAGSDITE